MDIKENAGKQTGGTISTILAFIKCFITLWAFSGASLSLILSGYVMNVPVAKYFFTLFDSLDGWGLNTLFMALGLGTVYYLVRARQKSSWVSGISFFFAICTVFGISYSKTDSWNCIFLFKVQFFLALLVMLGYYFAYKNCILFVGWILERRKDWFRQEPKNKTEDFLFRMHPFLGPLLFILVLALPWLIFFFPGTLQWDAHAQLWVFFGAPSAVGNAGQHPVILTQIMGGCVWFGRQLFHSDTIGFFFYTIIQFMTQSLTFAYAGFILRKLKAPVLFSWGALFYWTVYPFFPIWGYTMAKDSPFYIFILLHIVVLMDIIVCNEKTYPKWRQTGLFLLSIAGVSLSRNDGQYVILATLFCALILYRKHWKTHVAGIAFCLLLAFAVNSIYMPLHHIDRGGNTGDMLSIPLQQTARYLREHFDELTEEESAVLQECFAVELDEAARLYNPICADPVKANLRPHLASSCLKSYFKIWFQQFLKHPSTYIQAFLNQNYGYFYPNQHDYLYGYLDLTAVLFLGNSEQRYDDYVDIAFAIPDNSGREILRHIFYMVEKMPLFGMLKSAGVHIYILLGECIYLLAKKRRREILFLIPGLFVLLLRLFSPVACVRYILPILAALPVTAAWCYFATHKEEV